MQNRGMTLKQRSPYCHVIRTLSNVLYSFLDGFILVLNESLYGYIYCFVYALSSATALRHFKRTKKWSLWETRKDFFSWRYSIHWPISCPFWVNAGMQFTYLSAGWWSGSFFLNPKNVNWNKIIIIIIIIIYELIVRSLTWEWSAAHYNCITNKK